MMIEQTHLMDKPHEKIRLYKPEDYPTVKRWWHVHNESNLEELVISDTGVIVEKFGEPIAAGWIYFSSNSKLAQIGWVVSRPKLGPKERVIAIYDVLDSLELLAREQGFEVLQMISNKSGLTKMAISSGFQKISEHDVVVKKL